MHDIEHEKLDFELIQRDSELNQASFFCADKEGIKYCPCHKMAERPRGLHLTSQYPNHLLHPFVILNKIT